MTLSRNGLAADPNASCSASLMHVLHGARPESWLKFITDSRRRIEAHQVQIATGRVYFLREGQCERGGKAEIEAADPGPNE